MVRFTGNLSAQQIAGQVLLALDTAPDGQAERIRVVFAGMGESTFNAKGVVGAMVLLQEKLPDQQIDFVVVSIGTPPKALQKLGDLISNAFEESRLNLGTQVYLQLSLHAATDAKRKFLIPMAEVDDEFQIRNVVRGALSFRDRVGLFVEPYLLHQDPFPDRLMVTLNYLMLGAKGIDFEGNARPEDLRALIDLVREFGVKNFIIKLSHYNADRRDGHSFAVVTDEVAQHWLEALQDAGIFAIRFNSLATDVRGGCGQLTADEVAEMMHPAAVRELR
jgi:adenine C2-methylase RlmN of 23S rRNA A2503 and tRNA A37